MVKASHLDKNTHDDVITVRHRLLVIDFEGCKMILLFILAGAIASSYLTVFRVAGFEVAGFAFSCHLTFC
jgi:hypothetical protein